MKFYYYICGVEIFIRYYFRFITKEVKIFQYSSFRNQTIYIRNFSLILNSKVSDLFIALVSK